MLMDVPPTSLRFDKGDEGLPDSETARRIVQTYFLRMPCPTVYGDRVMNDVIFVRAAIACGFPLIQVRQMCDNPANIPPIIARGDRLYTDRA